MSANRPKTREEKIQEFKDARSTIKDRRVDKPAKPTPEWLLSKVKHDSKFSPIKPKQ